MKKLIKFAGYRIKTQKSIVLLYIVSEQFEKKVNEMISFIIASKE